MPVLRFCCIIDSNSWFFVWGVVGSSGFLVRVFCFTDLWVEVFGLLELLVLVVGFELLEFMVSALRGASTNCTRKSNILRRRRLMTRADMVWYSMVWYSMRWYGVVTVWHASVWYRMVWYGVVWCGMVWYNVVWWGLVWFGCLVWCGKLRFA